MIKSQSFSDQRVKLNLLEPVNSLKDRVQRLEMEKRRARNWQRQRSGIFSASTLKASFDAKDTYDIVRRRGRPEEANEKSDQASVEATRPQLEQKEPPLDSKESAVPQSPNNAKAPPRRAPPKGQLTSPQEVRSQRGGPMRGGKTVGDMLSPSSRQRMSKRASTVSLGSLGGGFAPSPDNGISGALRPGSPTRIATGAKGFQANGVHGILGRCLQSPEDLMLRKRVEPFREATIEPKKPLTFASFPTVTPNQGAATVYLDGSFTSTMVEGLGCSSWAGSLELKRGGGRSFDQKRGDTDVMSAMSPEVEARSVDGWSIPPRGEDGREEELSSALDSPSMVSALGTDGPGFFLPIDAALESDDVVQPPKTATPEPRVVTPPLMKGE